jgi:hypothetical protein
MDDSSAEKQLFLFAEVVENQPDFYGNPTTFNCTTEELKWHYEGANYVEEVLLIVPQRN